MDTFEAIYARRAVKHYDPDHVMPEEDVRRLFEAAIQSPTSFNIQHWRFVVVRDKELRKQIRAAGTTKRLEDLYLPYRPKKQTLAAMI